MKNLTVTFFTSSHQVWNNVVFGDFLEGIFGWQFKLVFFAQRSGQPKFLVQRQIFQTFFSLKQKIRTLGKFGNFQKWFQKNRYLYEDIYLKLLPFRKEWIQFSSSLKGFVNINCLKAYPATFSLSTDTIFPICWNFPLVRAYGHVEKKIFTIFLWLREYPLKLVMVNSK